MPPTIGRRRGVVSEDGSTVGAVSQPIFVRCSRRSRFTAELAGRYGFELLAIESVLGEALRDHYRSCFRFGR